MDEGTARKPSGLKVFGIISSALFASLLAVILLLAYVGSAKLQRLRRDARERLTEIRNSDPARPTLRGSSEPGNAWDDYEAALKSVAAYANANKMIPWIPIGPKANPEAVQKALIDLAGAIDQIHQGARRGTSRRLYEWEKGSPMPLPPLAACSHMVQLLGAKARRLAGEGKGREAAGALLDALQFSRDLGSDGVLICEMISTSTIGSSLESMVDLLAAGTFDKDALADLDRGLEVLDRTMPDHGKTMMYDSFLLGGMMDDTAIGSWGPQRLLYANAVEATDEMLARAAAAEALPWSEAQAVYQEIEATALKTWNPITKIASSSHLKTSRHVRFCRAQLRLLRTAVHQQATGELLDLDDPFGSKLKTSASESGRKYWSVGPDGTDDGGNGIWKEGGKDILLDAKK